MIRAALLLTVSLCVVQGQTMDPNQPPKTPDLPVYKLPPVFETKLPNGLTVLLVEDARFPIVSVRLGFPAGSKFDPKELLGLSETTAALLTEGTAKRTARQIAEETAAIGGSLHADSSADSLVMGGSTLSENLPALLNLMADCTLNASFPEDEVALRKRNRKQELILQRADAGYLADEKLSEVIFSPHPYAHMDPTPETIDRLDRAAFVSFRDRFLAPTNATLVLVGALPAREKTRYSRSAGSAVPRSKAHRDIGGPPRLGASRHPYRKGSGDAQRPGLLPDGARQHDSGRRGEFEVVHNDPRREGLRIRRPLGGAGAERRRLVCLRHPGAE